MSIFSRKTEMVDTHEALSERVTPTARHGKHYALGTPLQPPFPDGYERAVLGLGCFWGADRLF